MEGSLELEMGTYTGELCIPLLLQMSRQMLQIYSFMNVWNMKDLLFGDGKTGITYVYTI